MERLITQHCVDVENLNSNAQEGHYDLIGPDDEIILPQVWETMIKPDTLVEMRMWPMAGDRRSWREPLSGPLPPRPPLARAVRSRSGSGFKEENNRAELGSVYSSVLGPMRERLSKLEEGGRDTHDGQAPGLPAGLGAQEAEERLGRGPQSERVRVCPTLRAGRG